MIPSEFEKNVMGRFGAFCSEQNKGVGDTEIAGALLRQDVQRFEDQERTIGLGKTRRPEFNHLYFHDVFKRAAELKRRDREDLGRLFGED